MPLRLLPLVFALVGAALALPGEPAPRGAAVGGFAFAQPSPLPDPIPLRRVLLPNDTDPRLTAEVFRRLPREQFESRVQAAARGQLARANPPRIPEARYRAAFANGQLTGTADWSVANPHRRPGFVPLDPLTPAVGPGKWGDGRTAVLVREAAGVALWVDDPDGGTVTLPWSLRGTDTADEDRFEIAAPATPVAVWEFRLPADRAPLVPTAGVLLTGPFPGMNNEKVWKVSAGTVARWELFVRRPPQDGEPRPVRAARTVKHVLAPESATAVAEFRLESPRRPAREWVFQVDPPYAVTDVTGDDVGAWVADAARVTVTLREPSAVTRVRIGLTAPRPGGPTTWPCPTVKVADATLTADAVEVTVHPDLKLDGWSAGDYRVATAGVLPERGYRLAFTGTLAAVAADQRRPPTIRFRPAETELATEEVLEWRLEPGRSRLSAQVKARAVRGPVPAVAVQLAPGYTVERVEAVPDDPGMTWAVGPGNSWTIEPGRPLGTGQSIELKVEARGPPAPFAGDPSMGGPLTAAVPWPKFALPAATDRLGSVRVTAAGGLKVTSPRAAEDGTVTYRGREPEGVVSVTAAPPPVALTAVEFAGGGTSVRLVCRADAPVHSLTVYVPDGAALRAEPATARVRKLPAVGSPGFTPLFTATNGWGAIGTAGLSDAVPGSLWRVTFPTTERGELALRVEGLPAAPVGPTVRVPLPVVCGADPVAVVVRADGPGCAAEDLRRALKAFPPTVTLHDSPPPPPVTPRGLRYADLQLLTSADPGGRLTATLSGTVTGPPGRTFPIELPPGATVEAAAVGGKRLATTPGPGTVHLPLPVGSDGGVSFEVTYRLPAGGGLLRRLESPPPTLPGDPVPLRLWAYPDGGRAWPRLATQPQPEPDQSAAAWVIPAAVADAGSYGLAAVLLGLAVAVVRAGGRWFRLFAVAGLLLGAAVWALPGGWPQLLRPSFAAVAAGLAGIVLLRPPRSTPLPAAPPSPKSTSAPVALALALAASGIAQAPAPTAVYLVPDPVTVAGQTVFVPPALLDRLDRLTAPALPPAVILSAAYDAVAGDETVTVDAAFAVQATGAGPLVLPLAGVRLERATLNGKDAFPDAPDATRFVVALPAAGRHDLRLKFAVPVSRRGADRELRFAVPDVPATTVAFLAGANGRQPDVTTRRGAQKVQPTGTGPRAEADHGSGTAVAVRWRDGGQADGGKPSVSVRELGVWELGETDATLTAALAFRIAGGPVNRFAVELPDGAEPVNVIVRAGEAGTGNPRLRGWTVGDTVNGWRPLDVRLQEPTDGRVTVVVVAHPRRPLTARPVLRFPRAAGLPDADRDSYHAVRLTGVTADGIGVGGGVDFPADPLQKEFALAEFNWDAGPLARTVKRAPNATAELRPNLYPVPGFTGGVGEVAVTLGRRVGYEGRMRAADADAAVIEFEPPVGFKPTDVRGPALAGWGQTGNRVQAWFRRPSRNTGVRWSATAAADLFPVTGPPAAGIVVEVPWPRWPTAAGTAGEPIRATVRAAPGFEIAPVTVAGLHPVAPGSATVAGDLTYTLDPGTVPPSKFLLKAVVPKVAPAPKPKVVEPPKVEPPAPAPVATDPPVPPPAPVRWPRGILLWCGGYVAVLSLMRFGNRWRPECAAGVAVLAAAAVGGSSPLGVLLFAVGGAALAVRAGRIMGWWHRPPGRGGERRPSASGAN